jgi:hypothetical protein
MPHPAPQRTSRTKRLYRGLLAALTLALLAGPPAPAQEGDAARLRLDGVRPGGVRHTLTTSWGTFDVTLTNFADHDRQARVLVSYAGRPDEQYGRDVWVPAHATLKTWLLAGPVAGEHAETSCDFRAQAYEHSGAQDHMPPPPEGDERRGLASRGALYSDRRDLGTTVMLDKDPPGGTVFGRLPQPESRAAEVLHLVRTFRSVRKLRSASVTEIGPGSLPPTPQAFEGIDHFVVATPGIADDPVGLQALRRWLEHGGKVWVMLDIVDPEAVAPLLGDALDFRLVDRVGLTTVNIERQPPEPHPPWWLPPEYDRPVELARVLLPRGERAEHTVNGWPAWFTREVGRGKVIFTTVGARAWYRTRTRNDPPSPYANVPELPVAMPALEAVAHEVQPSPTTTPLSPDAFGPLLAEEIGYSVVSRTTLGLVFAAFLAVTLVLGLVLRRSRRPELLGWVAPAAALGAAGVFLALGEASRRAAPPTVAVAQLVDGAPSPGEVPVHGLLAVYRPESGPAEAATRQGGFFDLDLAGTEGQPHRLILTDLDAWHWEGLALPAGVRTAPFQYTAPAEAPVEAVARFGPDGLEGQLAPGPFREPADALLSAVNGRNMAVRLGPDGSFRAGVEDVLPTGQYLAGTVLSDRQQRRQELYRQLLKRPASGAAPSRNVLLAWAEPIDMHFALAADARVAGSALLAVPLRLERPPPGERVTVPGPLLAYRRIMEAGSTGPTLESDQRAGMHLRFQLPAVLLRFRVERARLVVRIDAPGRRVTVAGLADGEPVELHRVESPLDPIRVEIAQERLLRPDDGGGLHLNLEVSASLGAQEGPPAQRITQKWTIEYLELEVVGRAE